MREVISEFDVYPCWLIMRQNDSSRPVAVFWAPDYEMALKFARDNGFRMYQAASRPFCGYFEKDWAA